MPSLRSLLKQPSAAMPAAEGSAVRGTAPARRVSIYQRAADALIADIEAGRALWQAPDLRRITLPCNLNGRPYRGYNVLRLLHRGYDDPRWMTFNQAKNAGGYIRKGERGTQVLAWTRRTEPTDETGPDGSPLLRTYPVLVSHTVFNAQQIENLPPYTPEPVNLERVRAQAEGFAEGMGVCIRTAGPGQQPGYDPAGDVVLVRPTGPGVADREQVIDLLNGLITIASREGALKRFLPETDAPSERHETQQALRVEMARSMMGSWLGLPLPCPTPLRDSAVIELLQSDAREAVKAAADADRIMRYVLSFDMELANEMEQAHRELMAEAVALGAPEHLFDANTFDFWLEDKVPAPCP